MRIKQIISIEQYNESPQAIKRFITLWKQYYYPSESPLLTLGQCLELLDDVTRNRRKDDSDGRFFNNIFVNYESVVGYDGDELIDALFWEITQGIKHLFAARSKATP